MSNNDPYGLAKQAEEHAEFIKQAKKAKNERRLHTLAEKRLASLLAYLYPHDCAVTEVAGILGGRNDLWQFSFNGRRAVFELFFSPSQVPQDLRLLELAKADIKVAILLDRAVNPDLAEEFFHKKPDPFPYLWLSDLLVPSLEMLCLARLHEILDEDASINRLRRILSSPVGHRFEEPLRRQLSRIEATLKNEKADTKKLKNLTVGQYIVLQIIAKLRKIGLSVERLRALDAWLQINIGFAFSLVSVGLQAFLLTDLDGHYTIWAAGDFADSLILGGEDDDGAYFVICLNKIINDYLEASGLERLPLRYHFFHSYEEHIGKIIPIWEMEGANEEGGIENC